jgi:diacylglycerol kinase
MRDESELKSDSAGARGWRKKFAHAFRGLRVGVGGQNSFVVHFFFAAAVVAAAAVLKAERTEWYVLLLCIATVLVAEMFNSALESLARAVSQDFNPHIRDALDAGSAAVLLAATSAIIIGAVIFLHRLTVLGLRSWY